MKASVFNVTDIYYHINLIGSVFNCVLGFENLNRSCGISERKAYNRTHVKRRITYDGGIHTDAVLCSTASLHISSIPLSSETALRRVWSICFKISALSMLHLRLNTCTAFKIWYHFLSKVSTNRIGTYIKLNKIYICPYTELHTNLNFNKNLIFLFA